MRLRCNEGNAAAGLQSATSKRRWGLCWHLIVQLFGGLADLGQRYTTVQSCTDTAKLVGTSERSYLYVMIMYSTPYVCRRMTQPPVCDRMLITFKELLTQQNCRSTPKIHNDLKIPKFIAAHAQSRV